ncbi:MAG: hypothetical protein R2769_11760 [Saprospiraceae bacterium]
MAGEPIDDIGLPLLGKGLKSRRSLIIHDEEDNVVPFSLPEHFQFLENAELAVTEGLGHYRILKNEAVLDKVPSF